nr:blastula protease 10-like [Penaeus vannamei]
MLQGLIGMWKRESYVGLSHRDKLLANTIYGCLDTWLAKCNLNRNPCKNEGYLGEDCTCICPPGSEGRLCEIVTGGYYDHLKSPCSVEVKYPTVITSPNYPNHYDAGTWCVYRLQGEECHAPQITIHDFQMGPRDFRDQCFHDYLEIRNDTSMMGSSNAGRRGPGARAGFASSNTMILYFKGEEGGHRGFKATVSFNPIPGCCRTHTNSSAFFLHTPGYPNPYNVDFHCTYAVPPEAPAKVVVSVVKRGGRERRPVDLLPPAVPTPRPLQQALSRTEKTGPFSRTDQRGGAAQCRLVAPSAVQRRPAPLQRRVCSLSSRFCIGGIALPQDPDREPH